MKEYLISLGFHQKDVEALCKLNHSLESYDPNLAKKNIEILKDLGCSDLYIKNIVMNNTYFLSNDTNQTIELIQYLKEELKFTDLDLLFDSNAYLLNLEKKYLEDFVKSKKKEKVSLEKIRDLIELNLFIMDREK